MTSTSKSVPKGGVRGAIQKRKAAQRKPTPPTRLDIQQYMRSWEVEEDEALLAAIDEYGPRWRQVAAMVPGRSGGHVPQPLPAHHGPREGGLELHEPQQVHSMRSDETRPHVPRTDHDRRALNAVAAGVRLPGAQPRHRAPESPRSPPASPVPLGAHPGRMTMALAAGAVAPTDDIVMDLLLPQDLDELEQATEHGESSAAT